MPLNKTELKIIRTVVDRFINSGNSTKRKDLVTKFRSPEAVDRLILAGTLRPVSNYGTVVPSALGVECSEVPDSIKKSRLSAEVVLQALQNLYDITPERTHITFEAVSAEVNRIEGTTASSEVIKRGLFFIRELPALESYGPKPGQSGDDKYLNGW